MRVKTAAALAVMAGVLVFASPAMAWTYQDCVKVNFNHPDCKQYKPPVVTPPVVTPPVVPPVTIPAPPAPPVVVPPVAPPEAVPPVVPEAPKPKYDHPTAPRKRVLPGPTGTAGKTEQRGSSYTPQAQTRTVSASTENGTLPYTGLPAGLGALLGAGLMVGGAAFRRRVR